MEIIKNKARINNFVQLNNHFNKNEIVLFDIETTGFSANTTNLYLIGCGYYKDDDLYIIQWFNDDGKSEVSILE